MLAEEIESLKISYSEENSDYTKFVKGKTIAIVGPSQSMTDSNLGAEIDDFDYIIRFNSALYNFQKIKSLSKDTGSRTDILYLGNHIILNWVGMNKKGITKKDEIDNNVRFLVSASPSGNKDSDKANTYLEQELLGSKTKASNAYQTSSFLNKYLSTRNRKIARVGFISIVDLLLHGTKHISIYGMTFYHGGGNILREDAIHNIGPQSDHLGNKINTHNSILELDLFKKIYNLYSNNITIDKNLFRLINNFNNLNEKT